MNPILVFLSQLDLLMSHLYIFLDKLVVGE